MKKTTTALTLGLSAFLIATILTLWNPLQILQYRISDLFFRAQPVSKDITIVAIDEKSLSPEAHLGRFKDWPRSYYSQLLRAIQKHKPAVVAFDLDFREVSRGMSDLRLKQLLREYERQIANAGGSNLKWYELLKKFETEEPVAAPQTAAITHPDDADFQLAIDESAFPVVLSSTLKFSGEVDDGAPELPEPKGVTAPIFSGSNVSVGFRNVLRDRDGVLRRFSAKAGVYDFFPAVIARRFTSAATMQKNAAHADETRCGGTRCAFTTQRIAYTAKPSSYRIVSFIDALSGRADPDAFAGKIVLVGATARILQDFHLTPTSRDAMPGVEAIANIVQQILEGKRLTEQGGLSALALLFLLTVAGTMFFFTLSPRKLFLVFGIGLAAIPAAAFGLFQLGREWNVLYPEFAWILTTVGSLWYRNKTEFKEKRMIEKAFSHYVSPVVVGELVKHPESLKLGGKRETVSVMFSDIVGFTTLAEKMSPEDTVALLNDYLTAMTEIIFEHHGTLDKYQGDAIMAIFGSPLADPHHAVNVCHSALGMRRALSALHEKWNALPSFGLKTELTTLDFRVGIATGPAVIGNVGSEKRFDYTAIGDIVNLGSRLESVNRKYGTRVIVDKNTFVAVTENHNPFTFRKLDVIRVKGKQQQTEIFEVVGLQENATSDLKIMLDDFENGRILYLQRNFAEAKKHFEACLAKFPGDSPSQIYRNRCNFFMRKPPSMDWDGVVNLEEK